MALTWREVSAPDFSSSLAGYQTFSNLLGNAFGGTQRALTKFDDDHSKRVNNELALKVMEFTDPEAFALAKADLLRGVDSSRLDSDTLKLLADRPTALLREQQLGQENKINAFKNEDFIRDETALNTAGPVLAQIAALEKAGKRDEAAKLMGDNQALIGALDPRAQMNFFKDAQTLNKGQVDIRDADQRFGINKYDFDEKILSDKEGKMADNAIAFLGPKFANFTDFEMYRFGPEFQKLPPRVQRRVTEHFAGQFGGGQAVGGSDGSAPLTGGSGDGMRVMNYEARERGFQSVPDSVKTLGDASDFAIRVNNGGAGSSAMGTFQIVGQTLRGKNNVNGYAERVFGKDWRNVEYNLENQDKIAEAIFNDHRGSAEDLRGQWVSLSIPEAERLRKLPWTQARNVIAKKESGVDLTLLTPAARAGVEQKRATSIDDPLFAQFGRVSMDTSMSSDLVGGMIKEGGPWAKADRVYVQSTLDDISRKFGVKPAVAALIMNNSIAPKSNSFLGLGGENSGNGTRIDWKRAYETAAKLKSFELSDGAVAQQSSDERYAALKASDENLRRAEKALADKRARQRIQPGIPITEEIMAVEQAKAMHGALLADTRNPDTNYASFKPYEEEAAAPKSVPGAKPRTTFGLDEYLKSLEGKPVMSGF